MRRVRPLLLLVVFVAVAASGCISVTNIVRVKPNGSGTVELTILVNTAVFKQSSGMMGGGGSIEGKSTMPSADDAGQGTLEDEGGPAGVAERPSSRETFEGSKVRHGLRRHQPGRR